MPTGTMTRRDTASCLVLVDGQAVRCPLPGRWRQTRRGSACPIAVGDRVEVALQPNGEGVLGNVLPRHGGKLSRKAAGESEGEQVVAVNLDQLVVVAAAADPPLNRRLIDRLIVSGENGELDVLLVINKIDLVDPAPCDAVLDLYRGLGYRALATSATAGAGVERLREELSQKTSVLTGPSGVGKSTLLMAVQPGLELRVQPVSESTGKGRHTTSAVSLLPLDFGGYVADTPGIREFALYDLERDDLKHCFPEMAKLFGSCRFADCSHRQEPGCAVRNAVEAGAIDAERYESYCLIHDSISEPDPARRRR